MIALLVIGALPLLIYPFVALASLMSLLGYRSGDEPFLVVIAAGAFLITSLLYPLVYVRCLRAAREVQSTDPEGAVKIAAIPLWTLGLIIVLFVVWYLLGAVFHS